MKFLSILKTGGLFAATSIVVGSALYFSGVFSGKSENYQKSLNVVKDSKEKKNNIELPRPKVTGPKFQPEVKEYKIRNNQNSNAASFVLNEEIKSDQKFKPINSSVGSFNSGINSPIDVRSRISTEKNSIFNPWGR